MQPTSLMQKKTKPTKRGASVETTVPGTDSKNRKADSVAFEMTLHVPCHVKGRTASGSKWTGRTKTVALSEFGAHLLLPADVDLKGEVSIFFRIPSALRVLFSRDAFHVKAEIRPSGTDGHWPAPSGQKTVYVAFSQPLKIASWTA